MTLFLIGLVVFFAAHAVPMVPALRRSAVEAVGANLYLGAFALVSAFGLVLIVLGYGDLQFGGPGNRELWSPPTWTRHVAFLLMIPVFVFLVAAYVPSRIRDALRHPMLIAIKIWALAHLLANGDLASVILFGSFLAFAVIDRISVKKRATAGMSARGPLGDRSGGLGGDVAVVVIGLGLYVFMMFVGHEWLIGVPLIGG